jgi:hypothetical protein
MDVVPRRSLAIGERDRRWYGTKPDRSCYLVGVIRESHTR